MKQVMLKEGKVVGPEQLCPSSFRVGGETLILGLSKLLESLWREHIPSYQYGLVVIPIRKKGDRFPCKYYREISMVDTGSKILAATVPRQLSSTWKKQVGTNQVASPLVFVSLTNTSPFDKYQNMSTLFLDLGLVSLQLNAALDSVNRTVC